MQRYVWVLAVLAVAMATVGCSSKEKDELIAQKDTEIVRLQNEVDDLNDQLASEMEKAAELNKQLESALSEYQDKEQVWLEQRDAHSVITVSESALFASGNAELTPDGRKIVDAIVGVASQHSDREVRVEGHTDNVPIGADLKARYGSNWELSAGRACSVVHYMQWNHNFDVERLSAIGYGEHRPIADNESPEGRSKNRRVVIVIGPVM